MSSIRVHLDQSAFEPGSEVTGKVDWAVGDRPRKIVLSLLWHTEGKGTEDVEIVEQDSVAEPSSHGSQAFSFRLPEFPWSFSGKLISLIWSVEASVEPDGGVDRANLVSAPEAEEILL